MSRPSRKTVPLIRVIKPEKQIHQWFFHCQWPPGSLGSAPPQGKAQVGEIIDTWLHEKLTSRNSKLGPGPFGGGSHRQILRQLQHLHHPLGAGLCPLDQMMKILVTPSIALRIMVK